jgi:hypothetical protein
MPKEDISNLIESIIESKSDQVNALFDKALTSKISELIEDKKQELVDKTGKVHKD